MQAAELLQRPEGGVRPGAFDSRVHLAEPAWVGHDGVDEPSSLTDEESSLVVCLPVGEVATWQAER